MSRPGITARRRYEDAATPQTAYRGSTPAEAVPAVAARVRAEYEEMPRLSLTVPQAARLFGLTSDAALEVLEELRRTAVLRRSDRGTYSLARWDL